MLLSQAALPGMLARHHGAIISVASVAGHIAVAPLCSGTRFGLRGFMRSLRAPQDFCWWNDAGAERSTPASFPHKTVRERGSSRCELLGRGVWVAVISPGFIHTAMNDGREGLPGPEVIAHTIARLVPHPRRESHHP
jgi:NAD(P)-dependent dehydrogenase (short-subunit alcohol dehydrogenase family)